MVAAACQVFEPARTEAWQIVEGVVIAADGPNAADVDQFTLSLGGGQTMNFVVGRLDLSNGGLAAPHLREHMLSATPTEVWYQVDEQGRNIAIKYMDAEP